MKPKKKTPRRLDEQGPDVPEASVKLVDALRDYIWAEDQTGKDLLGEGAITREQFLAVQISLKPYRVILAELERFEPNPTLDGRLPRPR
jgi:hypothetical protein